MTKDAEGAGSIAKGAGDLLGGAVVDVKGAKGLVLAVPGVFRFQKEPSRVS
jgi:hypothetical protein